MAARASEGRIDPGGFGVKLARPVSKLRIVGQYFQFLGEQKKWWLLPLVVVLLLLGVVIVLTQGSAVAPFIYTLF